MKKREINLEKVKKLFFAKKFEFTEIRGKLQFELYRRNGKTPDLNRVCER